MSVAKMRMLRWMCGKTRRDRVRNETVREIVGVAPIEEKLRENRLRWFRHVYRRPGDAIVKRADRIALGSNATGRCRSKLTLDTVVRKDLNIIGTDFDELRKDVTKLRLQISSHVKIRPADSNPHRKRWPNINEAEDRMSHFFYKEPEDTHTGDFDGLLEAFHDLCLRWRHCLLCFFKFPPEAIIKSASGCANFKAKFFVSKPKPLENHHHHNAAASTSTATTNKIDDHGGAALFVSFKTIRNDLLLVDSAFEEAKKYMDDGGALFLSSNMIRNNLLLVDSAAFAEVKKYMDHLNVKINKAHDKFFDLKTLGGSLRDFDELRKDVAKLRLQISSHVKIRAADSNPHRKRWPNINEAEDFFYKEPEDTQTGDFDGLLEAYHDLSLPWRHFLLCFFKFPPAAIIKRTTMIYLWVGLRYTSSSTDDCCNEIFDELVEKGFIQSIYQNCSLVPDSCRMSIFVRSALYEAAKANGFTSNDDRDLDLENDRGHQLGHTSLINAGEAMINVGEAIINWESEIFDNIENIRSLYLGRWQSSATHHIELAEVKILHRLKDLKNLTFLSLRGISMITELPATILELKKLAILDLRACHNLEAIPEDIETRPSGFP
ncbi:hypothetical protein RHMOL_Rhmol03G0020600 [Rhododendron molle]|uniref:Uncharacterized protein n=1 Tax=Rhododendron molle TaxID=49168 RepID=A0ACC0PB43_RHOML|nr:hypothetical protein RHMOL_Rhmol03G0020600 [Rhododendron molle]